MVGRPLGLDPLPGELRDGRVDVVDRDRDVVVAVAEVVRLLAALIDGQLERVAVARQAHVDVVRRLELQLPALVEAERLVEADRGVDVAHADAGVDLLHAAILGGSPMPGRFANATIAGMPSPSLSKLVAGAGAWIARAVAAPAASADSIAYVSSGDIYLSTSDGARQYRVTSTGGYSDVSQADDGTMIAPHGIRLHRINRQGR